VKPSGICDQPPSSKLDVPPYELLRTPKLHKSIAPPGEVRKPNGTQFTEKFEVERFELINVVSPIQIAVSAAVGTIVGNGYTPNDFSPLIVQPVPAWNADQEEVVVSSEVNEAEPPPLSTKVVALPSVVHV